MKLVKDLASDSYKEWLKEMKLFSPGEKEAQERPYHSLQPLERKV